MKKIMAVYDVDSRYADRFAEFATSVSRYYLKCGVYQPGKTEGIFKTGAD